ncbi:hypothetical protein HAX54_006412 [Datura stramonium]|uniref:NB-ARC domain-containing protein n=1 Tax=Datura stramonium TaxID=4076 RepID=A0ABS8TA95_DATST|nr:hypothetical protein [Datura stramonium]
MTDLEARIKGFANVAEDKIEFGLSEAMIAEDEIRRGKKTHEKLREGLQQVAKDIDTLVSKKNNMVGRDKERKGCLKNSEEALQMNSKSSPIVGMGGIGKTTLAKQVLHHPSIQSRFDVCAWATISKEYNVRDILLSLLQSIIKIDDNVYMELKQS